MTAITTVAEFGQTLKLMEPEFAKVLPAHVTAEKFGRVVLTAVQNNPALLQCDRKSLWFACSKAAEQGLLPDGKEGVIISFGGIAKWIAMIHGILKLARNSGEIAKWELRVVKENDVFSYEQGDEERIVHKPFLGERGKTVAAYSVATLINGERSREVMSLQELEAVRSKSKAKNSSAWTESTDEMYKKTVARRHSKVLPMSTDKDETVRLVKAIESDDEDHDFSANKNEPAPVKSSRLSKLIESVGEGTEMPSVQEDEKFPLED